jgi:ABC-type uncharacterized transport system YnjBCD ATPase subunit
MPQTYGEVKMVDESSSDSKTLLRAPDKLSGNKRARDAKCQGCKELLSQIKQLTLDNRALEVKIKSLENVMKDIGNLALEIVDVANGEDIDDSSQDSDGEDTTDDE